MISWGFSADKSGRGHLWTIQMEVSERDNCLHWNFPSTRHSKLFPQVRIQSNLANCCPLRFQKKIKREASWFIIWFVVSYQSLLSRDWWAEVGYRVIWFLIRRLSAEQISSELTNGSYYGRGESVGQLSRRILCVEAPRQKCVRCARVETDKKARASEFTSPVANRQQHQTGYRNASCHEVFVWVGRDRGLPGSFAIAYSH